jgi:hypothetical protein
VRNAGFAFHIVLILFFVVPEASERVFDVRGLFALVTAHEKQPAGLALHRLVHAAAWSPINAQFVQAFAKWLAVGEVSCDDAVETNYDLRLGASILQLRQPLTENILSFGE